VIFWFGGLLFGAGLALSGLTEQEVVLGFLRLDDLGMGVTMAAALLVTLPIYRLCERHGDRLPADIRPRHIVGGAIFGLGWGLSGVCPGSAIASLGTGNWPIVAGVVGLLAGAYLHGVHATLRDAGPAATRRPGPRSRAAPSAAARRPPA